MADEQPPITPLNFTQHVVVTVERWPQKTAVMPDLLRNPHTRNATYDEQAQTLTFEVFNGGAVYKILGETTANGALVAELVEGSARKTSRRP